MTKLHNEDGAIMIIALLILVLLTGIGISSVKTSTTELQIATNHQITHMNFYAAESGAPHGVMWLRTLDLVDDTDTASFGPLDESDDPKWFDLPNKTSYTWTVKHQLDADGNVLYYGDPDGDHLWTVNTLGGMPLEIIDAEGTHPRGGLAQIRTTWIFSPAFEMPDAALWVNSTVDGHGVSGSIIGEAMPGSSCPDVPDIMYDELCLTPPCIDYAGDLGATEVVEQSTGIYPMAIVGETLRKIADITMIGSNNIDESAIITSEDNLGVVVIDGDSKTTNLTGYGILYVDGDLELAGNLDWHGLILTTGNIKLSGGGTKTIYGAIVGMGEAVAIDGSVDIQYDCELLNDMFDKFASYRMTSWRQM